MLKIKSIIKFTRKTKLDYATFLLLIILIFGSFIFFWVESPVNPTASTFDSSVFFMIVSITTAGYGNTVPFTRIGQLIAITAIIVEYDIQVGLLLEWLLHLLKTIEKRDKKS